MNFRPEHIDSTFKLVSSAKTKTFSLIETAESSLAFVLRGKAKFIDDDTQGGVVEAGHIFLHPASSQLWIQYLEDTEVLVVPFCLEHHFSENYLVQLFPLAKESKEQSKVLLATERVKEFVFLIRSFLHDQVESTTFFTLLKQELFLLFKLYYKQVDIAAFFAPVLGLDVVFKDFVIKNCLQVGSVDELAALANYSTSGFEKKFKRCFHASPYQWILQYKAKKILFDIQSGHKPFKELAEDYGFSSSSYFYAFCRKYFANSPRNLRKQGKLLFKNS